MSDNYTALIDRLRNPAWCYDESSQSFSYVDGTDGKLAAQALEQLARFAHENPASPPELHDLAAKVLNVPSLCHGFHPGPQKGPSSVAKVEAESKAVRRQEAEGI